MIKPRALRRGDRVAAISLSSGWANVFPGAYRDGKRQLEEGFGIQVVESRHALADSAWLAAHPEARAADLVEVLRDPSIHGIVSTIGGDDSIRILPFLDLSVIRENPKVFLGFSDTTVTHFAFLKAGVTSFYGPSIMAGFTRTVDYYHIWPTRQSRCFSDPPFPTSQFLRIRMDGPARLSRGVTKNATRNQGRYNRARVGGGYKAQGAIAAA